ncbi:MAG: aminotransferase class I/II-fold pyridoxal phosphate-dependent enzyme, partial [Betaproteobacteria bacterium]|nr:aminotransferase class I/II-fold pyridoxal phosphate-dependent enzyme [Betaproteobacteria bacterium]
QALLFGANSPVLASGRVVTIDALGGTGGLRVGAEYLRRLCPDSRVAISDPTWENHRGVFESAGFTVQSYTYYDPQSHGLDFGGQLLGRCRTDRHARLGACPRHGHLSNGADGWSRCGVLGLGTGGWFDRCAHGRAGGRRLWPGGVGCHAQVDGGRQCRNRLHASERARAAGPCDSH